ncbi:MAG: hypothetical protein AAGH68_04720 [Pseudomonadota bacterium]
MKFGQTLICLLLVTAIAGACAPRNQRASAKPDAVALAKKILSNIIYERKAFRDAECPNGAARSFAAQLDDLQVKVPLDRFHSATTKLDEKNPTQALLRLMIGQQKGGLAGCPGDPYPSMGVDLVSASHGLPETLRVSLWSLERARKNIRDRRLQAEVARERPDCKSLGNRVRTCPFIELKTRGKRTVEQAHYFVFLPETEGRPPVRCVEKTNNCTLFMESGGMGVRLFYVAGKVDHREAASRIDEVRRIAAQYLRTDI